MDAKRLLDLERDHPVTPTDIEAQRRLRRSVPSWLALDWRVVAESVPACARDKRPTADDSWRPFELEPRRDR